MVSDPKDELETILHQSRQLAGRLGSGSESATEITERRLKILKDAAQSIYEQLDDAPEEVQELYRKIISLS